MHAISRVDAHRYQRAPGRPFNLWRVEGRRDGVELLGWRRAG